MSDFLIQVSRQEIEGKITMDEAQILIDEHYAQIRKASKLNNGIPERYHLCMHADCPMAESCLHQLAFQHHAELGKYLSLINPAQCTKKDDCPHYANGEPVKFAKGFTNFQTHMYPKQYSRFMDKLILIFGRNQYFMRRRGQTILSPEEQEIIRKALKEVGVESHFEFDEYIESIYWKP